MADIAPAFTVYAPGGAAWSHPRVVWWARWLRAWGYTGRVPRGAVRACLAIWPAPRCQCGMYELVWLTGVTYADQEE